MNLVTTIIGILFTFYGVTEYQSNNHDGLYIAIGGVLVVILTLVDEYGAE